MIKEISIPVYAKKDKELTAYNVQLDYEKLLESRKNYYLNHGICVDKKQITGSYYDVIQLIDENQNLAVVKTDISPLGHKIDLIKESGVTVGEVDGYNIEYSFFRPNSLAEQIILPYSNSYKVDTKKTNYFNEKNLQEPLVQARYKNYGTEFKPNIVKTGWYSYYQNALWFSQILDYTPKTMGEIRLKEDFLSALTFEKIDTDEKEIAEMLRKEKEIIVHNNPRIFFSEKAKENKKRDNTIVGHFLNKLNGWHEEDITNYNSKRIDGMNLLMDKVIDSVGCYVDKIIEKEEQNNLTNKNFM
ncbi:MAG: hypothetical protein IJZ26_01205 [Clostridia bacterium]|nr:hypothetical protein [Clostridia bacterium]